MSEFTTVFEITSGTNGIRADALFRFAIGIAILCLGILGLVLRKRTQGRFPKRLFTPAFLMVWGVLWLAGHIAFFYPCLNTLERMLDAYHHQRCEVAEGVVHVSHKQPASGHAPGDLIRVGDREFEISYFVVTPGYKQTIAHGGVLREGVFARLHHYEGVILKVEIAEGGAE